VNDRRRSTACAKKRGVRQGILKIAGNPSSEGFRNAVRGSGVEEKKEKLGSAFLILPWYREEKKSEGGGDEG